MIYYDRIITIRSASIMRDIYKQRFYTQPYSSKVYPEDSIAVLYYNSCMIYGEEDVKRYKEYVDTFLDELKSKGINRILLYPTGIHTNKRIASSIRSL